MKKEPEPWPEVSRRPVPFEIRTVAGAVASGAIAIANVRLLDVEGDKRLDITGLHALIGRAQLDGVSRGRLPGWLAEQAEQANDGPLADDVAMLLLTPAQGQG